MWSPNGDETMTTGVYELLPRMSCANFTLVSAIDSHGITVVVNSPRTCIPSARPNTPALAARTLKLPNTLTEPMPTRMISAYRQGRLSESRIGQSRR